MDTQVHLTTAYHPQTTGLVEMFHRQLKSFLRTCLTGPNWTQELRWVLLGIQSEPKEDLGCSSAELMHDMALTVPGDFRPSDGTTSNDSHLQRLHYRVRLLAPIPTSQHGAAPTYMPKKLE